MKTGEPATQYFCGYFHDWDTSFTDFEEEWCYNGETEEDFETFRRTIDAEKTHNMLGHGKEADEIWDSIKGYLN